MGGLLGLAWLGQLGPDQMPVVGAQVAAGDCALGRALDGGSQNWRCSAESGRDIPEVSNRCAAISSKRCFFGWVERREVFFEMHGAITSNDVHIVNIV